MLSGFVISRFIRSWPLAVAALGSMAKAGPIVPLVDFTSGSALGVFGGANGSAGFSLNVTAPIPVSGLGFFDVGGDGLIHSHQVGLWTSGGILLATALVSNAASVVSSTSSLGNWREVGIAPVTLVPGSYVLGTFYLDANTNQEDQAVFFALSSSGPGVSFGSRCDIGGGSALMFPCGNVPDPLAGIFGPMAFTSSVPEPSTAALSLVGAVLLILRRRVLIRSRIVRPFKLADD
jgi:hypothetical protein